MNSVNVNDKVLDFYYRKQNEFIYAFYLRNLTDTIYVGQIFNMDKHGWTAVGRPASKGFTKVDGFRTRYDATAYLLRLTGYWKED